VVGVVDLYGSRLMAMERVALPRTTAVIAVLERAFEKHGTPERILSDNGPQFRSLELELFLAARGVEHTFTRPAHPWTNGRIERLFRTFKETIFVGRWLIASTAQLNRFCQDFAVFYNRDRPHSAYQGRTPDEVWFGVAAQRARGRVAYFDGALEWWRFG
jgi:transposase InsO family protein